MQTVTDILKGLSLATVLAFASAAAAQEGPSSLPSSEASAENAFAAAEVLSEADLDAYAGGTGVNNMVLTDQDLRAYNVGNAVVGDAVGSGQITLGSDAFAGYSGVGNFVLNTGHNNNLQSSMNVSIVLAPPGS